MNPELRLMSQKKVNEIVENIKTMDDCGSASKVIDFYQKGCPEDKEFIYDVRNMLCDKTFDMYDSVYGKRSGGINRSVTTEFNGKEISINLY